MQVREWSYVDKSTWGEGEWQHEPDKVQWPDPATGLPCLAVRNPRSGNWCGYVGVPESHPFYRKDCDDCRLPDDEWIDVHGGLTFADKCSPRDKEQGICHVPDEDEPDAVWWLGFDCAHSGDKSPGYSHIRSSAGISDFGEQYRDLRYVQRECTSLARQIATATS